MSTSDVQVQESAQSVLDRRMGRNVRDGYEVQRHSGIEWIGRLPDHWTIRPLKRACTSVIRKEPDAWRPYLSLEHIESGAGRLVPGFEPEEQACQDNVLFEPGDVLFGKLRPYLSKSLLADHKGCCPTELLVLRAHEGVLYPEFLRYLTLSDPFVSVANASAYGVKMPRTSWDILGSQPFPIPPLDEQRAIAAFLDRETAKIDALIEKKKSIHNLYDERYMQSVSSIVFGGLSDISESSSDKSDWYRVPSYEHESPKIGQLLYRPMAYGILKPEWTDNHGVPVVRITDVTASALDRNVLRRVPAQQSIEYDRTVINEGDLIVSVVGTLGSAAVVDDQLAGANLTRALARLAISDREISAWVRAFFETPEFQHFLDLVPTGTAQRVLNLEDLRNVRIPLPTSREQLRERLGELASEKKKRGALTSLLTTQIQRLREYRTALISAAVTGQIDVRGRV